MLKRGRGEGVVLPLQESPGRILLSLTPDKGTLGSRGAPPHLHAHLQAGQPRPGFLPGLDVISGQVRALLPALCPPWGALPESPAPKRLLCFFAAKRPVSPYSGYNGQLLTSVYQPTEMALMHKGPVSGVPGSL